MRIKGRNTSYWVTRYGRPDAGTDEWLTTKPDPASGGIAICDHESGALIRLDSEAARSFIRDVQGALRLASKEGVATAAGGSGTGGAA